jgi:hypothetical protein
MNEEEEEAIKFVVVIEQIKLIRMSNWMRSPASEAYKD